MPVPYDYGVPGGATVMVEPDLVYQVAAGTMPDDIGLVADGVDRVVGFWKA
jgi:hypothetical protein